MVDPRTWATACSFALLVTTTVGCAEAPDKSPGEQSDKPDDSEDPTKDASKQPPEELEKFARSFAKQFKSLNAFACEVDSDLCVESLKDADTEDVEMSFFLTFQKEDLKTKRHGDYLACFTKALKSAKGCVDDCSDNSDDQECSESGMNKCVDAFSEDALDDCDLKKPSAILVFEGAIEALNLRLEDAGGG